MLATILVRARNDEAQIGATLKGIFSQKTDFDYEVVVCDDASTDRTREIAAQFPIRFFERPPGPYKPGRTLNALVGAAKGEIVVFNNSDAIPVDDSWLANLVAPLRADSATPRFTFANQLPRPDATALVRKDSERAFGDGKVQATWRFFFSLASSATWRRLLVETPFDEAIQYSEDVEWAWRNSRRAQNPVEIRYCPDARVEHSHNYTISELRRRFRGEGKADRRIFGDRPSLVREILGAARETLRDWIYLSRRPAGWKEIPSAPIRRLVQRISHWQGMKAEETQPDAPVAVAASEPPKGKAILIFLEKSQIRGGIEIFAERHAAELRALGNTVETVSELPPDFCAFDEVIVHKCGDVATLEKFPANKTTYYVHDHDPICPRSHAYTPLLKNCSRAGGIWPCIICAPACRRWKDALRRVFSQRRRQKAMARLGRIVVISEFMKSRLVANGIPPGKVEVRPPVVKPPARPAANPAGREIDLLYVGQLIRGKGVQLLLEAMARMKSRRTLDILGTGNMEGRLRDMAQKLGLGERVHFHGFRNDAQGWMAFADTVVVPSFWQEPFGLVAAEAVALGKKVVAFAVGGLPEACGGKAVLVPPGDVDALAKALDGQGGAYSAAD